MAATLVALILSCRSGPASAAETPPGTNAAPTSPGPCSGGWWATAMFASYHINPDKHFDEFNPGIGGECRFASQWTAAAGYFRNSLDRPSFYGGAIYTPQFVNWHWIRLGLMGGIISGYNYGRFGLGSSNNSTGPVLAPTAIAQFGRFGMNFILVPPIPKDNLPFTVGFQAKFKIR